MLRKWRKQQSNQFTFLFSFQPKWRSATVKKWDRTKYSFYKNQCKHTSILSYMHFKHILMHLKSLYCRFCCGCHTNGLAADDDNDGVVMPMVMWPLKHKYVWVCICMYIYEYAAATTVPWFCWSHTYTVTCTLCCCCHNRTEAFLLIGVFVIVECWMLAVSCWFLLLLVVAVITILRWWRQWCQYETTCHNLYTRGSDGQASTRDRDDCVKKVPA